MRSISAQTAEEIFDMLVDTAGAHSRRMDSDRFRAYKREEFVRDFSAESVPGEYWFPSSEANDMKLYHSNWSGFSVFAQTRSKKGIAAEKAANEALIEMGQQI